MTYYVDAGFDPDWCDISGSGRALEWRTEPPTEPGWYWAKWYMGDDPLHMVEIVVEAGRFYVSGEYMCPIDDGSYTHWLGPLPVPEMPTA